MGRGLHHDEKLTARAVRVHRPGHGQHAQRVKNVVLGEAVGGKLPFDFIAGPSHAGAVRAAALDHEAGNDPVEG